MLEFLLEYVKLMNVELCGTTIKAVAGLLPADDIRLEMLVERYCAIGADASADSRVYLANVLQQVGFENSELLDAVRGYQGRP